MLPGVSVAFQYSVRCGTPGLGNSILIINPGGSDHSYHMVVLNEGKVYSKEVYPRFDELIKFNNGDAETAKEDWRRCEPEEAFL